MPIHNSPSPKQAVAAALKPRAQPPGRAGEQGRALWDAALQTRTHIRNGGFASLATVCNTSTLAAAREGVLDAVSRVRVDPQTTVRERLGFDLAPKVAGDPFLSRALALRPQGIAVLAQTRQEGLQSLRSILTNATHAGNLQSWSKAMGQDVLPRFAELIQTLPPLRQFLDARISAAMQPSLRGSSPGLDIGEMVKIFKELPSAKTLKELLIPDNEEAAGNFRGQLSQRRQCPGGLPRNLG